MQSVWFDCRRCVHITGSRCCCANPTSLGAATLDKIGVALANRGRVLLILDNVEHLSEAVAQAVEVLLEAAPNVRFLVTSQHKLGLRGEKVIRLQKLSLAHSKEVFTRRMDDLGFGDELEQTEIKTIETLMRLLDGIPLAIELAVAGVHVLSIEQLTKRYREHLDLQKMAQPDAASRHHSLRGAVSWSWSLLSPDERRIAAYCSLFNGGFR